MCVNRRWTTESSGMSSSRARSSTGAGAEGWSGGLESATRSVLLLRISVSTDPPRAFSSCWAWVMSTGKPSRIHPESAGSCLVSTHLSLYTVNYMVWKISTGDGKMERIIMEVHIVCLLDSLYYNIHKQLIRDFLAFPYLSVCSCSQKGLCRQLGQRYDRKQWSNFLHFERT